MTNKEFLESITLEGEEWRDVVGYEGLYMISSYGRCVSLKRYITTKEGIKKITEPTLRAYNMVSGNYLVYNLWKENECRHISIHRLVATAFLPNPNNYPEVDHIDTNRTNNVVSNLRWCTTSINRLNPITRKKNSASKKGQYDLNPMAKKPVVRINPHDISDVKFYKSASETKRLDGYNPGHVCEVCRKDGHRKMHKGYFWMWRSDWEASNQ